MDRFGALDHVIGGIEVVLRHRQVLMDNRLIDGHRPNNDLGDRIGAHEGGQVGRQESGPRGEPYILVLEPFVEPGRVAKFAQTFQCRHVIS